MLKSVIIITALLLGLPYGAKGVAASYSIAMVILFVPVWCYVLQDTEIRLRTMLRHLTPAVVSTVFAILSGYYISQVEFGASAPWLSAVVGMLSYGVIYVIVLLGVFRKWSFFMNAIKELRGSR